MNEKFQNLQTKKFSLLILTTYYNKFFTFDNLRIKISSKFPIKI